MGARQLGAQVTDAELRTLRERMAAAEANIANLQEESRAIRSSLHELVRTALADHGAAIARLAASHDTKLGIWWTLVWICAGVVVVIGAVAWLLEHQFQIIIKS